MNLAHFCFYHILDSFTLTQFRLKTEPARAEDATSLCLHRSVPESRLSRFYFGTVCVCVQYTYCMLLLLLCVHVCTTSFAGQQTISSAHQLWGLQNMADSTVILRETERKCTNTNTTRIRI